MNGPCVVCAECQKGPVKFRVDIGTFVCNKCYPQALARFFPDETAPAEDSIKLKFGDEDSIRIRNGGRV
jgi:hypothetical protein